HQVELLHVYNLLKNKELPRYLDSPLDLIAFSATTPMFPYVAECAKTIKKNFKKNIPLLCGGSHATSAAAQVLKDSEVDYVCVGEGEHFILDFLDYLQGLRDKESIANLGYKKEDGEVQINAIRDPIDPLDSLPFADREIFKAQHENTNTAFLSAGRGCPFQCGYCSNNYLNKIYKNKYLRFRKPETLIEEIKLLLQQYPRIKQLVFLDDVFILDEAWLAKFSGLYLQNFKLPYNALAHPATITDAKIKLLKESGCNGIGFGIQSGNRFIRDSVMFRHVSDEKISESIAILKKYNLKFTVDVIFGVPFEQKKHMLDTIKMCAENDVSPKSHIFYPLPNTRLEEIAIENKLFDRSSYAEDYHSKTVLNFNKMHKARVLFFHRYSKPLVSLYRKFAYAHAALPKKIGQKILDFSVCSDFCIYSVISLRSFFIKLRTLFRKAAGISEFRLKEIKHS
ncbi:MAG: radical SAM protein, partial [Candidatus Omnitrophica bacterium]|nr:radical SAM protein [Candidatus Omnitrophota bacterium]